MPCPAPRLLFLGLLPALVPAGLAQTVDVALRAAPGTVQIAPGVTENAWLYNGALAPVIRVTQGQTLRVRLHNDLPEHTIVHFHGQPVHQGMDGVPGYSRPETASGQEFLYELEGLHPGTYWFHPHSHFHEQNDKGLYGVLIVDPRNPADDPAFDLEQIVVLDDWSSPLGGSGFQGHLLNGRSSQGQAPIAVQAGQRLRLRLLNASATSNYVVALDGHPMTVTHADGNRVQPVSVQALPIGIGERYDVIVDCQNPGTWSLAAATIQNRSATVVRGVVQYQGSTVPVPAATYVPPNLSGGTLLSYPQLASFWPSAPISATPTRVYTANLGMSMGPGGMQWTINGQAWPNVTPWPLQQGDVVQLTMTNATAGMMHLHPMHLHGHFFRILGTAGGTTHAPIKDTVLIQRMGQPGSSVTVQFTADNPGRWLFHCHDLMHMMNGMMTAFEYRGDADSDLLPDDADQDPTRPFPVLTISPHAMDFMPGGSGVVQVEWQPGAWVQFLVGLAELRQPQPFGAHGSLCLDPGTMSFLGTSTVSGGGKGDLAYAVPHDPGLIGLRLVLQAMAGSAVAPSVVLSTCQALTVR